MSNIQSARVRISANAGSFDNPIDVLRGTIPQFWRSNDVQFEIGVFDGDNLASVSNLSKITIEIRKLTKDGKAPDVGISPLMSKYTTSLDDTTTKATWNEGRQQHAIVTFTAEESALMPADYWLSIWATTDNSPVKIITLSAGIVKILETGGGVPYTPPEPIDKYYLSEECDEIFVPKSNISTDSTLGTSNVVVPSQNAVKSYVDTSVGNISCANVGEGVGEVFSEKIDNIFKLKSLKAGTNVSITNTLNEITISATGGCGFVKLLESSPTTEDVDFIEFTDIFSSEYSQFKMYYTIGNVFNSTNTYGAIAIQLGGAGPDPIYFTDNQTTYGGFLRENNAMSGTSASAAGWTTLAVNNASYLMGLAQHLGTSHFGITNAGVWNGTMDISRTDTSFNIYFYMGKLLTYTTNKSATYCLGSGICFDHSVRSFKFFDVISGNKIATGATVTIYGIK